MEENNSDGDFEFTPIKKKRSKKEPDFKCSSCNDTNPENFYKYLPSRCIKCKRKYSKERREDISTEKKLTKVEELDPDCKIRDVLENLIAYDKVVYNSSILDFIKENEARTSSLELEVDNRFKKAAEYISKNFNLIEELNKKVSHLESIIEFQNQQIQKLINEKI